MKRRPTIRKRIREAVYVNAEGRSALTGDLLDEHWELDHRVPRASGGSDDITNLQALTMAENRAKGAATPPTLLDWQAEFLSTWDSSDAASFLLVALPGAGKTIAALTVADQWIREDPRQRRVLIIVPTDPLRTQWQTEAARLFGLQFQTKEFTRWKSGMVGSILTYHLIAGNVEFWKLQCHQWETLVIADEIHHTSDSTNNWGPRLKEAVGGAKRRLLTSGTPFRGDSTRIPFVNYDSEGRCVADYRYDYPRAIRDQVIRIVCFQHETGIVRCVRDGSEESLQLSSDTDEAEADAALSRIVEPGSFTDELLRAAHHKLMEVRSGMPNAGGLVICKDQDHAVRIAKQLQQVTRTTPDVIVSDDERATSTIDTFRSSLVPWVVAVRQITEGVDIKRLIVLAYLTHYRSALFFRQAIGRIVRNMRTPDDMEAYCFMPDHPTLVAHARDIINAQVQAITDETDEEFQRAVERTEVPRFNMVLGTEHTGSAGIIIEGEQVDPKIAVRVHEIASQMGCTLVIAHRIYQVYEAMGAAKQSVVGSVREKPLEQQLDDERGHLSRAVKRAAWKMFPDRPDKFRHVWRTLVFQHIRKFNVKDFTLEELRQAKQHVIQQLNAFMTSAVS